MNEKWSKEQIESYKTNHPTLSDVEDEIIIECLEFEKENGPMTEIYHKDKVWKMEEIKMEEKLKTLVYTALGEASMCWTETPIGVFDSTQAKEIGEKLISDINSLYKGEIK